MSAPSSTPALTPNDPRLAAFERFTANAGPNPAWLAPLRKDAISRFAELGFPTLQHEDWRFTNVAPIAKLPFKPAPAQSDGLAAQALDQLTFAKLPGHKLVFINGHFSAPHSNLAALPAGVRAESLAHALAQDSGFLEKHLARQAKANDSGFTALNTAFFQDGAFIHVPANVVVPDPIQLIFITHSNENGTTSHPRNLIVADAHSRFTVIESFAGTGTAPYFTNTVTEFEIGDQAVVEHLKFQDESQSAYHIAALHSRLGRQCHFVSHSIALGAKLSRNNIRTRLDGEHLECVLNGLYFTRDEQLADHHMIVEHAQPHCASHEYFNGILDDKSRGVFHGRIYVHPIAQKTDAKQTNKNVLLSDDATANTKPQLEIYADDVKCTHGATIGQLNNESIFYLRSRGIGLDQARRILIHSFAGEILDRIRCAAAREELDATIWQRLEEAHIHKPAVGGAP